MFQIRFGKKIRNAIAPPTQSQRLASKHRSPLSNSPSTKPAPKIAMEYLFSNPKPARTPNQIHSLVFFVLIMRISRYAQPIQNNGSNAFMVSRPSAPNIAGATRAVMAAKACAKRLPPSWRAISAVRTTSATPASAGNKRSAGSDWPNTDRHIQTISAISGGWSTYPQSRCLLHAR